MKPIKSDRFICTEISGGAFDGVQCRVLVDRETGVNYLWTSAGYSGGLTVLVDAEGKPIVTPVPKDED
ncbi:MAG: xylan 1,4-beta-xylosidase [Clostridia bacterium]|nr:xylan 1,4-beta-xylosidase [Clostridia bacterium]